MTLIERHVEDFNHGVRTGDFGPMLVRFSPDAELRFEGERAGPRRARIHRRRAFRPAARRPDRSGVGAPRGERNRRRFPLGIEPDRVAGEMRIETDGPQIRRMVVTLSS